MAGRLSAEPEAGRGGLVVVGQELQGGSLPPKTGRMKLGATRVMPDDAAPMASLIVIFFSVMSLAETLNGFGQLSSGSRPLLPGDILHDHLLVVLLVDEAPSSLRFCD